MKNEDEGSLTDDDVNNIVKVGGGAMLFSSVMAAATVAVGRSQMARKMYSEGEKGAATIDAKLNHEASNLAMKALGRATAYVFGTFTAAIGAACYTWDIYSLRDLRRTARSFSSVQVSKDGSKPTTWEDIFPEEVDNPSESKKD